MCGIAGILSPDGPADRDLLGEMAGSLAHRGPDGRGDFFDGGLGLAHTRLKIIDLSERAAQPMRNEDGTLVLVYNGEIYNYIELREELEKKGHRFRSDTDSEVVLHSYEEEGPQCLNRFNGMFALALWDTRKRKLLCARDRFGVKPFYYIRKGKGLFFGSEIKALLPCLGKRRTVNRKMLYHYVCYGLMDHTGETFFEGVSQLPPSHFMLAGENGLNVRCWYELRARKPPPGGPRRLRELLESSVRLRLRSDVPVGLLLSGGMDSASIAGLASAAIGGERFRTFSAVSGVKGFDEGDRIRLTLKNINATSELVFVDGQRLVPVLRDIIRSHDEPVLYPSIYAHWHLMKKAKEQGVVVLLHGQGADELLGGYPWYLPSRLAVLLRGGKLPELARELKAYSAWSGISMSKAVRQVMMRFLPHRFDVRFDALMTGSGRALAYRPAEADRYSDEGVPSEKDPVTRRSHMDLFRLNLPYILHYEDRSSMAFSRESRAPFLDFRLVEHIYSLPSPIKVHGLTRKAALREAMKGLIPELIRTDLGKKGFSTPAEKWVLEDAGEQVEEVFRSAAFRERGLFDAARVREAFRKYSAGDIGCRDLVWRSLCAELWLENYFDAA